MKPIETKHTMAAIEKIKKDLSFFTFVLSYLSMIVFAVYYIYLIIINATITIYLVVYSILFMTVLASFITELILKQKENDSRKKTRIKLEKRRLVGNIIKIFKYLAKSITIGIVIYEIFKNPEFQLSLLMNIVSIAMLVIQLISEFVIYFVKKYIDYFKFALEMDFDSSFVLRLVNRKMVKAKALESLTYEIKGESMYTKQELKIINTLKYDADKLAIEKDYKLEMSIKNSKEEIKKWADSKLTKRNQIKINKKYDSSKKEAMQLLEQPDKLDKLLIKAEQLIEKLPSNVQALKYIPEFLSLINNYLKKRYTSVSKVSLIAAIGVIVYFVSPIDIIPVALPVVGYVDEAFVIGKCLDMIEEELEKFIQWRDKQEKNNIDHKLD